jgi:hypothetical protein
MRLYYTLSDFSYEMIEIECAKCGRPGRLRTARLLAEHGPDIKLPDLLRVIAQCPRLGNFDNGCETCYSLSSQIDLLAISALPSEADIAEAREHVR